ncbi:hypothetical protein D9M68_758030 [compost metagenome]
MQVDLGLATAGDPGEEEGIETAETGAYRFCRGALFGIQRQFRLRQPTGMPLVRGVSTNLDGDQAFFAQQVEAVFVQLQLAEELVGDAVRVLGDGFQCLALARRADQTRVVQARPLGQVPEAFLSSLCRLALAQQYRQGPAEGVAEAVLVILRGPQAQLEQGGW